MNRPGPDGPETDSAGDRADSAAAPRSERQSDRSSPHIPVMLDRIVDLLAPALTALPTPRSTSTSTSTPTATPTPTAGSRPPVLVDATLGMGGHAEALLEACPDAHLIGIDRDPDALAFAGQRLARFGDRVQLVEAVYDELVDVLARLEITRVQGVLLDLGLSSLQIDRSERGFAYATDAPLDMRMDGRQPLTAADVVNTYPSADLIRILRRFGEEKFAERIVRRIVAERDREPFTRSARLVQTIGAAVPMAARKTGGHPAKRTFQALRIEVNRELDALANVLPDAVGALALGGRIVVLAYHSLEDRLVKQVLRAGASDQAPRGLPVIPAGLGPQLRLLTRGVERPGDAETQDNPRAASARLRAAVRIEEAAA